LDLSNIKKIIAKGVGLTEIPGWLRECHNLKVLKLDRNKITAIQKEELPSFLTHLHLEENALKAVDISALKSLTLLNVANNRISHFSLGGNSSLLRLELNDNGLSSFDMGSNCSLTHLHLENNQLTCFFIEGNNCLL
jgi:Leucine-rich repeat (LRR) protein